MEDILCSLDARIQETATDIEELSYKVSCCMDGSERKTQLRNELRLATETLRALLQSRSALRQSIGG